MICVEATLAMARRHNYLATHITYMKSLPRLRAPSLDPPILPGRDAHLVAFALLFRQLVAFLGKRDVDNALAALIFVENDLVIIRSTLGLAPKDIGNLNDLVPGDDPVLNRPVNIALL